MRIAPARLYLTALLACSWGCAENREPLARQHLESQIAADSKGAFTLVGFKKTNGYNQERDGMKLYTLEWEAQLQAQADGWKAGWSDFRLASSRPNALEAAVMGVSTHHILRGATAALLGKSTLQKADRGWRVMDSAVTASKILPAPDNPGEGRSADINTFFPAFKKALSTKNTNTIAQFVAFPFRYDSLAPVTQSQFTTQLPLGDEQIHAIVALQGPTRRADGSYEIVAANCSIEFHTDSDGYWKWTSLDYGAEGD